MDHVSRVGQAHAPRVQFAYGFGPEENNEFINRFNDVLAFFINAGRLVESNASAQALRMQIETAHTAPDFLSP